MLLRDKLVGLIAESMKARNHERTETLRMIKAELLKAEVADRKAYNEQVEIKTLLKMVASHKDSIAQFVGRQDLIDKETAELAIIQEFTPKEVSEEDIIEETKTVISSYQQTNGKITMKDMKAIMDLVKSKYPTASGAIISKVVKDSI